MCRFVPTRAAIVCCRARWDGGGRDGGGRRRTGTMGKVTRTLIFWQQWEMTPAQSSLLACLAEKTWLHSETHAEAWVSLGVEGSEGRREGERLRMARERERKMCVCMFKYVPWDGVLVFRTADVFITFNLPERGADKMFQIHVLPLGLNAPVHSANSLSVGRSMLYWDEEGRFGFWRVSTES